MTSSAKPFPLPLVAAPLSPDLAPADDGLDYLVMPQGMSTFQAPRLPEGEALQGREGAWRALDAVLTALQQLNETLQNGADPANVQTRTIALDALSPAERTLVNQVLGEGEVSAQVLPAQGLGQARIQESVFAGVWRVLETDARGVSHDHIEVGDVPRVLRQAAADDAAAHRAAASAAPLTPPSPPEGVMNAQPVLVELADQRARRDALPASDQQSAPAHVVNLSLLPMSPQDIAWLDHVLGTGRVLVLSRGYGNCRITNALVPHTWRVVYYNSQDSVLLNTVEVTGMPEVCRAAPEDLADSAERLTDVLAWMREDAAHARG
jgi:hydrogenase-1 operon protein HyaF